MIRDAFANLLNYFRHNKTIQIVFILLFIAVGVFVMVSFNFSEAKAFIRAHRGQAALIGVGIYLLLGFTLIPASPLTLFLAVYLGPWETVLIATTGNTFAAILEYEIGQTMGDVFNFEKNIKKLPFGLAALPMTSPFLLLAGRLLPLGKQGFSFVCGAYQVPFGKYLWTSIVMYIFSSSLLAFTGAGILRLIESMINQI